MGCVRTKPGLASFLAVLAAGCFFSVARCELPSQVYDDWKKYAEEYASVEVLGTEFGPSFPPTRRRGRRRNLLTPPGPCTRIPYVARVEIRKVLREPSNLEAGDVVDLETWFRQSDACPPGPSAPPRIGEGWCGTAYMNSTETDLTFEIAAGGKSFEEGTCADDGDDDERPKRLRACLNEVVKDRCRCRTKGREKKRAAAARRCARRKARSQCDLKERASRRIQTRFANYCARKADGVVF